MEEDNVVMAKPGRKSKSRSLSHPRKTVVDMTPDEKRWERNQKKYVWQHKKRGLDYIMKPYPGAKLPSSTGSGGENSADLSSTDKMLEDMRKVYEHLGGANTLLSHMKSNPKDYAAMVQNLMKVDASIQEAMLKKGGGDDARGVFVVLKGLGENDKCPHCGKGINDPVSIVEQYQPVQEAADTMVRQAIDMSSMESILNPGAEQIREGGDW